MGHVCGEPVPSQKVYDNGVCEADRAIAIRRLHFRRKPIDNFVEIIDRDAPRRIVFWWGIEF